MGYGPLPVFPYYPFFGGHWPMGFYWNTCTVQPVLKIHVNKDHLSTKTTSDSSHQEILYKLTVNRDHLCTETRGRSNYS